MRLARFANLGTVTAFLLAPTRLALQPVQNQAALFSTTLSRMADTTRVPVVEDKYPWKDIWNKGVKQGDMWDIGRPEPELSYELALGEKGALAPIFQAQKTKTVTALVPGCGRGYSVLELARYGFKAVGADISASAVETAKTDCPHENAQFICSDFFKDDIGTHDLVYDSTFLCAIPPAMWLAWAKRMSTIVSPGGYLAMYVYPVSADESLPELALDGSNNEPGPPHRVSLKLIRTLLEPYNFEEVTLRLTPHERIARAKSGRPEHVPAVIEYFMVWKKTAGTKTDL